MAGKATIGLIFEKFTSTSAIYFPSWDIFGGLRKSFTSLQ